MVRTDEGEGEEALPLAYFFREPESMGPVDAVALALARGRVLDLGACAGAHTLPLLERGLDVHAVDVLPEAVRILLARGVTQARVASVFSLHPPPYFDTLLALMNGTSLAGTLGRLGPLLGHLRGLVAPGGQLLIDSTAISGDVDEGADGEVHFQLQYEGLQGPPFPQLFVGEAVLADLAASERWSGEVVAREDERYLMCLTPT